MTNVLNDPTHMGFNEPQPPTAAHTKLVIKEGERHLVPFDKSEDWVDPPLPNGFQVAIPATIYTQKDLLTWAKYLSPPRFWPQAFTQFKPMKTFISNKLEGRKVRLTEAPHPLEIERLRTLLHADLQEGHAKFNAVAVRRALGWQIIGGYILLEERQGSGRKDPVEKPLYHGQRHWWNVTPMGMWVDFTPRGFKQLVLVESAKVKVVRLSQESLGRRGLPVSPRAPFFPCKPPSVAKR